MKRVLFLTVLCVLAASVALAGTRKITLFQPAAQQTSTNDAGGLITESNPDSIRSTADTTKAYKIIDYFTGSTAVFWSSGTDSAVVTVQLSPDNELSWFTVETDTATLGSNDSTSVGYTVIQTATHFRLIVRGLRNACRAYVKAVFN